MGTMNISLPDQMKNWVEEQAKTGRYANSSDYVRDLIRRDQARNAEIEQLRAALIEGEQSGISDRSPADILQAARERLKVDGHI